MQKVKTILPIIKNGWAVLLLFLTLTTSAQENHETLKVYWPEEYNWQTGSDLETESMRIKELRSENGKENIIATTICMKGVQYSPMEIVMNGTFNDVRKYSPKATIVLIERDKDEKNHWIIFKIESISSKTHKGLESRLYYIVQGDHSLYSNFMSVNEKSLSTEKAGKWKNIFMRSELVSAAGKVTPLNAGGTE